MAPVSMNQRLMWAEQLREAGNLESALEIAAEVQSLFGGSAQVDELIARCHLSAGHWSDARAAAKSALSQEPDSLEARRVLGVAHLKDGKLKDALEVFKGMVEIAPELPHGWFWQGVTFRVQQAGESARAALLEAMTLKDDSLFVDALAELSIVDVFHKRPASAFLTAQSAVELDPESVSAHRALAICAYETGLYPLALAAIEDARRLAPESSWTAWLDCRYRAAFGHTLSIIRGWARLPYALIKRRVGPREALLWSSLLLLPLAVPVFIVAQAMNTLAAEAKYGRQRATIAL